MSSTRPRWLVVTFLITALLLLGSYKFWLVSSLRAQAASRPEPIETVEVASVREVLWQASASAAGTVVAKQFVRLSNRVAGPIESVEFRSGQAVSQGQVLLRLDAGREYAQLKSAMADIELATLTLDRKQKLAALHAVSHAELDVARAQLEQASAQAAVLREAIEDRVVRAPFAGRVGLRDVHPGQYLAEGTELTTLESLGDDVDVDLRLPQEVAAQLEIGDEVRLSGGILNEAAAARVTAIDVRADAASRHVRVRAEARGLGKVLKPGAFVDASVAAGPRRPVLAVPLSAVRRATYGDHVYLITEAKPAERGPRATQRMVQTGSVIGTDIVVLDGLASGDRIAAYGAFKLREGVLISIAEPAIATTPPPASSDQS